MKDMITNGSGKNSSDKINGKFLDLFDKDVKSINRRAKNNIFQFPLLVSDNIEKETLNNFRRASEREYASLIQYVIAGDDLVDIDDKKSKEEWLKSFHRNHDISTSPSKSDVVDLRGLVNSHLKEGTRLFDDLESLLEGNLAEFRDSEIELLNRKQLVPFKEQLTNGNINDMTIKKITILGEDGEEDNENIGDKHKRLKYQLDYDQATKGVSSTKIDDDDIKALNRKVPTKLELYLDYKTDGAFKSTKLILGISCVSHLIPTDEMMYFISKSIAEDNFIFRTIQWTTGEIEFFKDFILSLDRIKYENSKLSSGSSKWWHHLRQLGKKSTLNSFFNKNDFIPNATMALTMAEVEHMKNVNGVSVMDNAGRLLDTFFLMRLVILDDISEVAYYFNDDTNDWSRYSYNELFRGDKSGSGSEIKALVDLISNR